MGCEAHERGKLMSARNATKRHFLCKMGLHKWIVTDTYMYYGEGLYDMDCLYEDKRCARVGCDSVRLDATNARKDNMCGPFVVTSNKQHKINQGVELTMSDPSRAEMLYASCSMRTDLNDVVFLEDCVLEQERYKGKKIPLRAGSTATYRQRYREFKRQDE